MCELAKTWRFRPFGRCCPERFLVFGRFTAANGLPLYDVCGVLCISDHLAGQNVQCNSYCWLEMYIRAAPLAFRLILTTQFDVTFDILVEFFFLRALGNPVDVERRYQIHNSSDGKHILHHWITTAWVTYRQMVLSFCVCAVDRATTVTAWRFLLIPGRQHYNHPRRSMLYNIRRV